MEQKRYSCAPLAELHLALPAPSFGIRDLLASTASDLQVSLTEEWKGFAD
jgi:hypothetical protein